MCTCFKTRILTLLITFSCLAVGKVAFAKSGDYYEKAGLL
jgi:hypothetical protein